MLPSAQVERRSDLNAVISMSQQLPPDCHRLKGRVTELLGDPITPWPKPPKPPKPPSDAPGRSASAAKPLKKSIPSYPKGLRKVTGDVVLIVDVTERGETGQATVLKGLHPATDALSVAAITEFTWQPAKSDGKNVASRLSYVVRWRGRQTTQLGGGILGGGGALAGGALGGGSMFGGGIMGGGSSTRDWVEVGEARLADLVSTRPSAPMTVDAGSAEP